MRLKTEFDSLNINVNSNIKNKQINRIVVSMTFSAHLEYLFHLTCGDCKFYWTYASMDKLFDITKNQYNCPNCGCKSTVKLELEL